MLQNNARKIGLELLVLAATIPCYVAFVIPTSFKIGRRTGVQRGVMVAHSMLPFQTENLPTSLIIAQDDVGMDQAFTDTVSFTDGPIRTMGIVFAVFVVLLVGLKSLTGQMDAAIEQVLVEFEATLKRFYPQRWETMEAELEGLAGDERDIKLLQMMEELQEKDPTLMSQIKDKFADTRLS